MALVSSCNRIPEGRDDTKGGSFTCLFLFHFLYELPIASYILGADPHTVSSYFNILQMTLQIQVIVTVYYLG